MPLFFFLSGKEIIFLKKETEGVEEGEGWGWGHKGTSFGARVATSNLSVVVRNRHVKIIA